MTAWAVVLLLSLVPGSLGSSAARADSPAPAPAARDEQAAREAFERGRVFYDAGQFDQASSAFEEAYRLSGRDGLLYNIYLANRDANQQEAAAAALRGYLAKVPNIENRAQLEARLGALEAGLARQREQEREAVPTPHAEVTPSAAVARPAAPPARSRRFYAGVSLAALGGAALIGSLATGIATNQRERKLEDGCEGRVCPASLAATADSGERLARTTDALLFGGIALAGAGAALLVLGGWPRAEARARANVSHGEASTKAPPQVTAGCSFQRCLLQTTLRF
jgi:tetratricopeptide (TPR) repeat protein